jgi:hypothetical protein
MDVGRILTELRQERDQIDEAIVSLERLILGRGRRRGRPPKWLAAEMKKRGRPPGSKNKATENSETTSDSEGQAVQANTAAA